MLQQGRTNQSTKSQIRKPDRKMTTMSTYFEGKNEVSSIKDISEVIDGKVNGINNSIQVCLDKFSRNVEFSILKSVSAKVALINRSL